MTHFTEELDRLHMKVMQMVVQTEQALSKTVNAFTRMDAEQAQKVVDHDQEINKLEVEIDQLCLRLLALEQPVARDLRFILGAMRLAKDLERIGDEAANISDATIFLSLHPSMEFYDQIQTMGQKAYDMLQESIIAFSSPDTEKAVEVCRLDFEVDEIHSEIMKVIINYMTQDNQTIEVCVQSINVARRFERVADLATNIAETTMFIVQGTSIKHTCQFDDRV